MSQIILSATMGFIVDMTGTTTAYMAASFVAGVLSIVLSLRVPFTVAQLKELAQRKK
jgi:hypothetical protein